MKSSTFESKLFQSRSKGEIPARARRKERLSHSKLKQACLIDSDAELFMNLIQYIYIYIYICVCVCLYSQREDLPKNLFKIIAQECKKSTSGRRGSLKKVAA